MGTRALKKSSSLTIAAAVGQAVIAVPLDSGDKCACTLPVIPRAAIGSLCEFFFLRVTSGDRQAWTMLPTTHSRDTRQYKLLLVLLRRHLSDTYLREDSVGQVGTSQELPPRPN